MFQTQEARAARLTEPLLCKNRSAWLGIGYYFWDDAEDAIRWGNEAKRATGSFDVYESAINCESVLDTVFNEAHYRLWLAQIEKVGTHWYKKTGVKLTIRQLNDYFREKAVWTEVDGVLFQDLPQNQNYLLVVEFYYRKRIQLVAFKKAIVLSFTHYSNHICS
ncbi:MAG: hypothetical protein ABSE63_12340 [Thermoguttaceae bacterium]|jgi:hypothetical protein